MADRQDSKIEQMCTVVACSSIAVEVPARRNERHADKLLKD
jgi:hypothetical protein